LLGVLHAAFSGTALVNVAARRAPADGRSDDRGRSRALLGARILMTNYGLATPVVMLVAHIAWRDRRRLHRDVKRAGPALRCPASGRPIFAPSFASA
jgi:hypothetical protein